jgi:hypothetical protein
MLIAEHIEPEWLACDIACEFTLKAKRAVRYVNNFEVAVVRGEAQETRRAGCDLRPHRAGRNTAAATGAGRGRSDVPALSG